MYYDSGLGVQPESCVAVRDELKQQNDTLHDWISSACREEHDEEMNVARAFEAYNSYRVGRNLPRVGQCKAFKAEMQKKGYSADKSKRTVHGNRDQLVFHHIRMA